MLASHIYILLISYPYILIHSLLIKVVDMICRIGFLNVGCRVSGTCQGHFKMTDINEYLIILYII